MVIKSKGQPSTQSQRNWNMYLPASVMSRIIQKHNTCCDTNDRISLLLSRILCYEGGRAICAFLLGFISKSTDLKSSTSGSVDWADNPAFFILNEYTFNPFVHWSVIWRALGKTVGNISCDDEWQYKFMTIQIDEIKN